MYRYLLLLPLFLTLASCAPTRDTADQKLGSACVNGIIASFSDTKDHFEMKSTSFAFKKSYDGIRLREVTVKGDYTYGTSSPEEKTYTCTFSEEWSMFSWLPEFYNMQRDDQKYGNFNGTVAGETETIIRISNAMDKVLR